MTPKEKAKELVDKMFDKYTAKECALIAIDELIKNSHSDKRTEYWENVKFEIRKL
jgi:hypothetical protein